MKLFFYFSIHLAILFSTAYVKAKSVELKKMIGNNTLVEMDMSGFNRILKNTNPSEISHIVFVRTDIGKKLFDVMIEKSTTEDLAWQIGVIIDKLMSVGHSLHSISQKFKDYDIILSLNKGGNKPQEKMI